MIIRILIYFAKLGYFRWFTDLYIIIKEIINILFFSREYFWQIY